MAKSVCLPLPIRSLKEVEKFVGFQRRVQGSGDWALAQYIRAAEIRDRNLLNEILAYNQEDLDATLAVYEWLKTAGKYSCTGGFPPPLSQKNIPTTRFSQLDTAAM